LVSLTGEGGKGVSAKRFVAFINHFNLNSSEIIQLNITGKATECDLFGTGINL
jgi:hypothetical protein